MSDDWVASPLRRSDRNRARSSHPPECIEPGCCRRLKVLSSCCPDFSRIRGVARLRGRPTVIFANSRRADGYGGQLSRGFRAKSRPTRSININGVHRWCPSWIASTPVDRRYGCVRLFCGCSWLCRNCLPEVPPGKFTTGARLQVLLKLERRCFFVKFDHNERSPRPMLGGVRRETCVVRGQPCKQVGGDADVILRRVADAFQDVDESLRLGHGPDECKRRFSSSGSLIAK
jgi:hypothetical protein